MFLKGLKGQTCQNIKPSVYTGTVNVNGVQVRVSTNLALATSTFKDTYAQMIVLDDDCKSSHRGQPNIGATTSRGGRGRVFRGRDRGVAVISTTAEAEARQGAHQHARVAGP